MTRKTKRLRRVELATPGSSEKMMAKAAASKADMVFLDLEDAVAPKEKVAARQKIVEALKGLDWTGKTRCVRINDLQTEWAYEDIIHVVEHAHAHLDLIMIPKVMRATDVEFVDTLLTQIEKKLKTDRRIGLEVLIEEVDAMIHVEEIAKASSRLEALIYGVGDYSASQGIDLASIGGPNGYPGDIWHYGRHKITIAARSAGIDAIDGPFGNFNDAETYSEECRRARLLGMVGKWAIHPAQIDPALQAFSPKQADVDAAREMIAAYSEAERQGLGAITFKGEMIDAATVRIVRNIVEKADLIGM
ncbi:HpcH/HpaI aldolase/citrate lyase family protein [Chelatococcus reniformis]|uniref:Malyl-CoA lyase n=1 Tax=Chelatococcus reniformis TaxID=1494448 RepID=A0A916XFQ8_9HYPH|nr:CoA ester lyase [Chelatococcus reniformis]GGC70020.1 malyl-CoA lyase [Chelatococcus reniformis]